MIGIKNYKILAGVLLIFFLVGCSQESSTTAQSATQGESAAKPLQKSNDAAGELKSLIAGKSDLQWIVKYDVSTTVQGIQTKMAMMQYSKGKDRMRTDVTMQSIESRSYMLDGVFYSCTKTSASWRCLKYNTPPDQMPMTKQDEIDSTRYSVAADGTMQIAGVTAKCFKVVHFSDDSTAKYCYSPEGIPLYTKFESERSVSETKAVSYEKVVSDKVFDMPAEPVAAPARPSAS